jgi:hypothetical protein
LPSLLLSLREWSSSRSALLSLSSNAYPDRANHLDSVIFFVCRVFSASMRTK